MRRPSIGIFAHSTNPRGGVVHAMQLAEALCEAGQDATLLAPALPGATFARAPRCPFVLIPAAPAQGVAAMVARRIAEIAGFLTAQGAPRFDVHHAQDPITANALVELVRRGAIGGFVRTVHHLEDFADPLLADWQDRAVRLADHLCCVSVLWQERIAARTGVAATLVGNGVDTGRFSPVVNERDAPLRRRLGLGEGPVLLTVGGIEARKNTPRVLRAFLRLREARPDATLVIAGGATLLEHGPCQAAFETLLRQSGAAASVIQAGVIADADMPALYRIADVVVSASVEEGFGLCAIEAMAAGAPAVVSRIAPFTEHLREDECLWVNPGNPEDIAQAMRLALRPAVAAQVAARGRAAAARFTWADVAARHAPVYAAAAERALRHA